MSSTPDDKPLPKAPKESNSTPTTTTTSTPTPSSPTITKKSIPSTSTPNSNSVPSSPKRPKTPKTPKQPSSPIKSKSTVTPATVAKENVAATSNSNSNVNAGASSSTSTATTSPPSERKAHAKKGNGRGGGNSGGNNNNKKGSNTPKKDSNTSDGLNNLKNIITELKDTSTSSGSNSNHNRTNSKGHKSTNSGSNASTGIPNVTVSQSALSSSISSNLNPNAGGFQPGTLGVISDMMDESVITPTASQFDLMTGMPNRSTPGLGGSFAFPPSPKSNNLSLKQQQQQQQYQQQYQNQFNLAQQQQFLQLQAQQQQFQLQQLALLGYGPGTNGSNLLTQSIGPGSSIAGGVSAGGINASTAGELMMAEQMAIQQQLEALRLQQASLLSRFSEMQVAAQAQAQSQGQNQIQSQVQENNLGRSQSQSHQSQSSLSSSISPGTINPNNVNQVNNVNGTATGHRRIQSQQNQAQQSSGQMGSFNQTFSSPGNNNNNGSNSLNQSTSLPKGHGRRHSVNVLNKSTNGGSISSLNSINSTANGNNSTPATSVFGQPMVSHASLQPPIGLRNSGFTFPKSNSNNNNNLNNLNQSTSSPSQQQQQQSGEIEYSSPSSNNNGGYGHGNGGGSFSGHNRRQSGSISSLGGWSMNNNSNTAQANLAEASSHLQQLAVYRASAGHSRVPSFGMSQGGVGPGQLSMSGYGGGLTPSNNLPSNGGGGGGSQARKSLFAPYLPQASIPPLLTAGKLVIGVLRVNKRNRSDAYVTADGLDSDIYICGSKDRNRALEGDVVAIELLDVDEVWGTKKDKEEKKRKKEESNSYDPRATRDSRKQEKKKDEVEVEGQGLLLLEEEEVTDDQKPTFAGHVVAVVERAPGQLFSGMLGVLRPSSAATQQKQDAERREREGVDLKGHGHHTPQQTPKIIWFRPTDKRVPLIAIPTDQAPHDFIDRPENYSDRLFVACIKRWPISSLHPFGTLVEELGVIGDIETETAALLKDCNFTAEDFSESVLKCLPPIPSTITEQDFAVRRDYRSNRVFTIDPETAKDLDDALHIVKLEDGNFEVGVHIADVTHYVRPNTALDREARKRATTVYLVQRAVPMLPPALSEELCSLTAGEDKLTFSTVFIMSPEARVLSTWYGKTVINSKVKLAYSDAQSVIDEKGLPEGKDLGSEKPEAIEGDILLLAALARQMRARRFDSGALRIDNVKVSFGLDEDGLPIDCLAFERKEANELIEEFMLLANLSVAGKIASGLPEQALLRRHEPPIDRRLDAFVERMGKLNIKLDATSSESLMKSFEKVTDKDERVTLQHLSTKSMQRAKYFCTGMLDISKYHHYALNLPLYTHFTSPIRRYADVIVHRQLEAVLAGPNAENKFTLDTETVAKVAQVCNTKKDAARLAQEQSAHLFLCVLISQLSEKYGPVIRMGTVIGVLDAAFDVLVPEFGVEKRCRMDALPIENHVYEPTDNSLKIYWKKGIDVLSWTAESQNDAHLQQVRGYAELHANLLGTTSKSSTAEAELFDDDSDSEEEVQIVTSSQPEKVGENEVKNQKPRRKYALAEDSDQVKKSQDKSELVFPEVEQSGKHSTQIIKELARVPVILTADMTKSPPVIKVLCINPFK